MGYEETACFEAILSHLRPKCALEIGTAQGARLSRFVKFSEKVISVDCDENVRASLEPHFPEVRFVIGNSNEVLPQIVAELSESDDGLDFVFLDANHDEDYVRKDLNCLLKVRPKSRLVLLMHDTFNPSCRKGILEANWDDNPHCHFVDLDFSPGILHPDAGVYREMWGGLGFALFLPQTRTHELTIKTTHQLLFEAAFRHSIYYQPPIHRFFKRLKSKSVASSRRAQEYFLHNWRPARWWRNRRSAH